MAKSGTRSLTLKKGEEITKAVNISGVIDALDADVKELNLKNIQELIDYNIEANKMIAKISEIVGASREKILEYLKAKKLNEVKSDNGIATAGSSQSTEYGDAIALAKILKEEGKTKLFPTLVKPQVTAIKKLLGEDCLEEHNFMKKGKLRKYTRVTIKSR